MKEPRKTSSPLPVVATAAVCIAPLYVLGNYSQIDYRVLEQVVAIRTPSLDQAAQWMTQFGGFGILFPATLVLALFLLRHDRRLAGFTLLTMAIRTLLVQGIKFLTARARPGGEWAVYIADGYSFPSGHAAAALTFALTQSLVIHNLVPGLKDSVMGRCALAVPVFAALAIGLTRPYLGVHFPTDVVAGWVLAIGTVALLEGILIKRVLEKEIVATPAMKQDQREL